MALNNQQAHLAGGQTSQTGDIEMVYTVLLDCGTIGEVDTDTLEGQSPMDFDHIAVYLHDENGNYIEVNGKPIEILDVN